MDFPGVFIADGNPVEGGGGIGYIGDVQAIRRQAGETVGDEAVCCPVAVAEAVGTAVLTHAEGVAGGGAEAAEGVGVADDGDVGVGPVGGGSLLDVDLVIVAIANPCDSGRLVVVRHRGDDGLTARDVDAADELHDGTGGLVTGIVGEG